jgi:CBS domain containing-hemolysin-like protein
VIVDNEERQDFVGILLVKKLILLSDQDRVTVRDLMGTDAVSQLPLVRSDRQLFDMLNQFQEGKSEDSLT